MNEYQRRRQMIAVHIQYKKLCKDGVFNHHEDPKVGCHIWATGILCRLIATLTACHNFELNVLRDTLNGKTTKIHARLRDVLTVTKKDPDAWVNSMMHRAPAYARFREVDKEYTVETVPLIEAFRMLKQEELRAGKHDYRKPDWKPLNQKPRTGLSVPTEQQMLWGGQS